MAKTTRTAKKISTVNKKGNKFKLGKKLEGRKSKVLRKPGGSSSFI